MQGTTILLLLEIIHSVCFYKQCGTMLLSLAVSVFSLDVARTSIYLFIACLSLAKCEIEFSVPIQYRQKVYLALFYELGMAGRRLSGISKTLCLVVLVVMYRSSIGQFCRFS